MINDQIRQQVADKLESLLAIANQRFGRNLLMPVVYYDCHTRMGGYHQNGTLHFNPTLLNQNLAHYMDNTVVHEMAHYVQLMVYPESLTRQYVGFRWRNGGTKNVYSRRKVHGREWQFIMRLFGIRDPERCHHYDTSSVPVRRVYQRFPLYCGCENPHTATLKLINKIKKGKKYSCMICGKSISLIKPLTSIPQPVEYSI